MPKSSIQVRDYVDPSIELASSYIEKGRTVQRMIRARKPRIHCGSDAMKVVIFRKDGFAAIEDVVVYPPAN